MEKEPLYIPQTSRHPDGSLRTDAKTIVKEKTSEEVITEVKAVHEAGKEKEPAAVEQAPETKSKASK